MRISLRQKHRVKVNGKFVKLPYLKFGKVTIYRDPTDNLNIVLKLTAIGEQSMVAGGGGGRGGGG